LQATEESSLKFQIHSGSYSEKIEAQKELVESLKAQWKLLWSERYNDKVRAEDVSANNYNSLSIERGTIIYANRDFKAPTFKEILEQHMIANPDRFVQPDPQTGGWKKFVKTQVNHRTQENTRNSQSAPNKAANQQPRKCGRGWLHNF
jgi:hypothetical protein